jgi:hypothetical protein
MEVNREHIFSERTGRSPESNDYTIVFAPLAQLALASKSENICRQSISPEGSFLYFLLILSKKLSSASARQLVVYH